MRRTKRSTAAMLVLLAALNVGAPVVAAPSLNEQPDLATELKLPILEWKDSEQSTRGIVVGIHGLTFYAEAYDELARHFASLGYRFYAPDLRGFGTWKERGTEFANGDTEVHFTQSKEDLIRIIRSLKEDFPGKPIYLVGESLGANYALWIASSEANLVDGVIVNAPCYKTKWHPRPRWVADFWKGLLNPKTPMKLEPYIRPTLSHDPGITERCMQDSRICRELSPVELVKTAITNKNALKEVDKLPSNLPILILAGEDDQVYKTESLPELVSKMGSQRVDLVILKDRGHLLLEKQRPEAMVINYIDSWLATYSDETLAIQRKSGDLIAQDKNAPAKPRFTVTHVPGGAGVVPASTSTIGDALTAGAFKQPTFGDEHSSTLSPSKKVTSSPRLFRLKWRVRIPRFHTGNPTS